MEMGDSFVFGLNCACHLSILISSPSLPSPVDSMPALHYHHQWGDMPAPHLLSPVGRYVSPIPPHLWANLFCAHFPLQMSQEESTRFYDQLNHHIFELVSSSDANERKGGILAIGKDKPPLAAVIWGTGQIVFVFTVPLSALAKGVVSTSSLF